MWKKLCSTLCLSLFLAAGLNGCSAGGTASTEPELELVSLSITPADTSVALDTDQQFTATGIYADNTTRDLTATVEWTSSDPDVAVVESSLDGAALSGSASSGSRPGRAYARAEGTTTIKAHWRGKWGSADLKVNRSTLVSLSVSPTDPQIGKGTGQQFTATGTFSDNTTQDLTAIVKWSSSREGIATISNTAGSAGLATSVAAGSTTISAAWGNMTGATTLTVKQASLLSIAVTPAAPGIAKGTQRQFTATGTYSDNTTQDLTPSVTWTSSNTAVATISNAPGSNGLASASAPGTTSIAAALGNIAGTTILTVNPATLVSIAVTPAAPGIAKGTQQQFIATGTYSDNTTQDLTASAAWTSSNTGVATISNAAGSKGLATSIIAGTTSIAAASGSIAGTTILTVNAATLVSIAVTPFESGIAKGTDQQFTATGSYSDGTTQNLTASVTWSSSNTAAATISNAAASKGLATSIAAGTTTIKAVSGSVSGTTTLTISPATLVSIAVTPANTTIAGSTSQQFKATGAYSDGSAQDLTANVTWSSSNTGAATISNAAGSQGLASSNAAGSSTIKAVLGTVSGTTNLVVVNRSATLSWDKPLTNTDGTALTDLAGYRLYYGTGAGTYTKTVDVGNVTTYTINTLAQGTYYFAVKAVNSSGAESDFSNEAIKTIP